MTKKEMFMEIINLAKAVQTGEATVLTATTAEIIEFAEKQIEQLSRKTTTSRKPTKNQIENEGFKADILTALAMADAPVSIKELMELCPSIAELSNQRISRLLKVLCDAGQVERTSVKRIAHFSLTVPDTAEESED